MQSFDLRGYLRSNSGEPEDGESRAFQLKKLIEVCSLPSRQHHSPVSFFPGALLDLLLWHGVCNLEHTADLPRPARA